MAEAAPLDRRGFAVIAQIGVAVAVASAAFGGALAVADRDVCTGKWRVPSVAARDACAVATADGRSPVILVTFLSAGVAAAAIGVLIIARRRGPLGWLLLTFGLSFTLGPAAGSYALHAVAVDPRWPGSDFASWVELAVFNNPAVFAPIGVMLLLFPTGRPLSRRWSPFVAVLVAGGILALIGVMVEPIRGTALQQGIGGALLTTSDVVEIPALPLLAIGVLAGGLSVVLRARRAEAKERASVRPVAVAAVTFATVVAIAPVAFSVSWLWPAWGFAVAAGAALVPVTLGIAIIGHGLYDLDRIVNRTAVFTLVSALIVVTYVVVVSAVSETLGSDEERLGALAVTALVAIGIQPLRGFVQRSVERLFYGHRSQPQAVAAAIGREIEGAHHDQPLLTAIAEATAVSLRLPFVEITAADKAIAPGASARTVTALERESLVAITLTHRGSEVGTLRCLSRQETTGLDSTDRDVLALLAPTLAAAVHATSLATALEQSRERLVEAQEVEQRRIRRDLHDGLGPALTGIGLAIGELQSRAADEDAAMLARLADEVSRCIQEIRRIAHDLQPVALAEHGLVGALHVHAERFSALGLTVDIETAGEPPPSSSHLERATYRIVSEAMTNVHRHARASHCLVQLRFGAELEIVVVDDGTGLATANSGVGLKSIEERVTELDGRWSVGPAEPSGTRLHVVLPGRTR